jgi:hypothetical protein
MFSEVETIPPPQTVSLAATPPFPESLAPHSPHVMPLQEESVMRESSGEPRHAILSQPHPDSSQGTVSFKTTCSPPQGRLAPSVATHCPSWRRSRRGCTSCLSPRRQPKRLLRRYLLSLHTVPWTSLCDPGIGTQGAAFIGPQQSARNHSRRQRQRDAQPSLFTWTLTSRPHYPQPQPSLPPLSINPLRHPRTCSLTPDPSAPAPITPIPPAPCPSPPPFDGAPCTLP